MVLLVIVRPVWSVAVVPRPMDRAPAHDPPEPDFDGVVVEVEARRSRKDAAAQAGAAGAADAGAVEDEMEPVDRHVGVGHVDVLKVDIARRLRRVDRAARRAGGEVRADVVAAE